MIRSLLCIALLVPSLPAQETPSNEVWFLELQREDGSWDADEFPEGMKGAVPGRAEDDVAVTSLLTLAFLGNGAPSTTDRYSVSYDRAVSWLASQQAETGRIGRQAHGRSLHHHALATLALCEHSYFQGDPDYSAQASRGIALLEKTALAGGGWSASGDVKGPVDPVTTAWVAMALRSAREAKLANGKESTEKAVEWFRRHCDPETGCFRPNDEAEVDHKATLCALITRLFNGEQFRKSADIGTTFDEVIASRPEFRADPEYYYLATVVAYQMGGKRWMVWNKLLKKTVLEINRGGVDTRLGEAPVDPGAPVCGSLGSAAFMTLCLEFYFRYAKIVGAR